MQFSFDFEYDMHKAEEQACATDEPVEVTFEGGRVTYRHSIHTSARGRVTCRRAFKIDGKRAKREDAIALATEMELTRQHGPFPAEPETEEHQAAIDLMEEAEIMGAVDLPNGAELLSAAEHYRRTDKMPAPGNRDLHWIHMLGGKMAMVCDWEHLLELVCFDHPSIKSRKRPSRQRDLRELRECAEIAGSESPKACYWMGWHVMDPRGRVGTGISGRQALESLEGKQDE